MCDQQAFSTNQHTFVMVAVTKTVWKPRLSGLEARCFNGAMNLRISGPKPRSNIVSASSNTCRTKTALSKCSLQLAAHCRIFNIVNLRALTKYWMSPYTIFPSSICWRILPGVPTTISMGLLSESSWGLRRPPPLTMVHLNRAWWLIDFATRKTYKAHFISICAIQHGKSDI